jgi:uncharacterized protein YkwD
MAGMRHVRKWRTGTILLIVAAASLLAAPQANAATSCANADVEATAAAEAQVTEALVCLVNEQRVQAGLNTARVSRRLTRAALKHSADMVSRRYFAHQSSGGSTMISRAKREGYMGKSRSWWIAENIAWGNGELSTAAAILESWLESPPHRANILSAKARDLGLGMAAGAPDGGSGGAVFTLMLGKRG